MTDVTVIDRGSVVGFQPITLAAHAWFEDNVSSEAWQWLGPMLYVDRRLAADLMDGLSAHGFQLEYRQ